MGLNDEREKLRTAREWLEEKIPGGMDWEAAFEHVVWTAKNSADQHLVREARMIVEKIVANGLPERRTDK